LDEAAMAVKGAGMTQMFKISLPDGSVREVPEGSTPPDVAAAIGPGLAKAAIAATVDGELRDITRPFEGDASLALVTSRDEAQALELARHDFAHVLAEAVQNLFPGTQITFGPATADGFYYDFAPKDRPFTEEDLPAIEAEMRRVIARDEPLVREVWTRDRLIDYFKEVGETFKAEWAAEKSPDEVLTVYRSGPREDSWLDMCRGPHLASTGKLDPQAFKLTRVSGGLLARRPEERDAEPHLRHRLAEQEAARRAPPAAGGRRPSATTASLGRRWTCSTSSPKRRGRLLAPQGLSRLAAARSLSPPPARRGGYDEVKTPQLMDARQWERSGHWGKYRENMFVVPDEIPRPDEDARC
jgi:threonyl-tRNA synthetase